MASSGNRRGQAGAGGAVPSPEALAALGRELVHFVPDTIAMLRAVATDPRVPHQAKVEAGAALAYLVSPANRLTSWVPIVGKADDVAVLAFAMRRLLLAAGEPVLREHWRGSPRGLEVLLGITSALMSPRGMLRRTALLSAVTGTARDVIGAGRAGAKRRRSARSGEVIEGEVIEGEVIGRRPGSRAP